MGGLPLPAGSLVKVGFQVYPGVTLIGSQSLADDYSAAIEGCVYASGGFDLVQVQWAGGYFSSDAYVTAVVQTAQDHGDIEDVGSWVQGILQECLPGLQVLRRDKTVGVGLTDSQGNQLPQGNQPGGAAPSRCDWSKLKWADWIACQFGVTPSSAALIGVGLGVGVVVLIASLARK
ncbi:MAG: hypothetical protein KGJ13_05685 [Patescibacteria group bacterium]|nr:hypothetical protein [Patescibacteria group bacterium]